MDKTVKRRLVGALVIVLLAIILVPAWLDGSARRLRDEDAFIVPLPPPDSRKAMVEPESIGAQLETAVPKLVPLPDPLPTTVQAIEVVEEEAAKAEQDIETAAAKKLEPAKTEKPKAAAKPKPVPEKLPDPVVLDLDAPKLSHNPEVIEEKKSIKVEIAESAKPRANWIVQVGSFASRTNAEAMVKRLKKGKLKAFMRDFDSNGDTIYRVLVGPFVRQTEADDAKRTIDRRFQVKSFVANWRG